ncbi:MAG: radical SAM protein [Elusimicrobiota bacterium]|nr:radical SAM protein [Elusimicrobiota bacterium]
MKFAIAAKLNTLTLERNIPAAVTIELTRRCPLACLHCYLPETRGRAPAGLELTTAQWKNILAQLAGAGALYLVYTGGEPLLRPDLAELCRHAKKLNFDVRVFSTGLGLTPGLAAEFKKAGVSAFELSFYGKPALHDSVTGVKNSSKHTLAAARLLKAAGIKVKFKTPLMKKNLGQAGWLRKLAETEGFDISFDPTITSTNDGNASALPLRLSGPQLSKAVKLLSAPLNPRSPIPDKHSLAALDPRLSTPDSPTLDFLCGAGRNVCAVGPEGGLYSCLQVPVKLGDLTRQSFSDIWKNSAWLKKWRSAGMRDLKGCASCADIDFCSRCPGLSLIEEGNLFAPNKPACEMAKIMSQIYVSKSREITP